MKYKNYHRSFTRHFPCFFRENRLALVREDSDFGDGENPGDDPEAPADQRDVETATEATARLAKLRELNGLPADVLGALESFGLTHFTFCHSGEFVINFGTFSQYDRSNRVTIVVPPAEGQRTPDYQPWASEDDVMQRFSWPVSSSVSLVQQEENMFALQIGNDLFVFRKGETRHDPLRRDNEGTFFTVEPL